MRLFPRRRRWQNTLRSQRLFSFEEHARGRERLFKRVNVGLVLLVLAALVVSTSRGRDAAMAAYSTARGAWRWGVGLKPERAEADARWQSQRLCGIEQTRARYQTFYERDASPRLRGILDAAGMSPRDALFRWANYDWTVVLSSKVFERDDAGRAYRMRPNVRSFWMRDHALPNGISSFFFLPDTADVRLALGDADGSILPESFQASNSWGCRGAEPDRNAEVRGLVIGDSFMQGLFVPDDQTPPAQLERALRSRWGREVSLLNTGHIGYSPEQYYYTLLAFYERFKPHFVIVSVCANDFGDAADVIERGIGDWDEAKYWLETIEQFNRVRNVPCFLVPVPFESQVNGRRMTGNHPGRISNDAWHRGIYYIDPIETFVDENLRLLNDMEKLGKRPAESPLYNGHLKDGHFSPKGCALWADVVARRVTLLFKPKTRAK